MGLTAEETEEKTAEETAAAEAETEEARVKAAADEKTKADAAKAATEKKEKEAAEAKARDAVPETYEFRAAEGMTLDKEAIAEFSPAMKAAGLSQKNAQLLIDAYTKRQQGEATQWAKQIDTWKAEVKADPDIGGEKADANMKLAQRVVKRFGNEALAKELQRTGYQEYTELVRIFVKIGRAMGEDTLAGSAGGGGSGDKTPAEVMYGKKDK